MTKISFSKLCLVFTFSSVNLTKKFQRDAIDYFDKKVSCKAKKLYNMAKVKSK